MKHLAQPFPESPKNKKGLRFQSRKPFQFSYLGCGADRTRTGVQTNSPQAFYMFIYVLIVGKKPEHNKPTFFVEEWS